MSSHHIVREKQEPALLLLGLYNFDLEQLGQLLEWSPTVITTVETAEVLNSMGIKIDWIITRGPGEVLQSDVKLIPTGNGTLTETALTFLLANGYPAVNIVTDVFELQDYEFYVDKINIVVFNGHKKIYAITPGFSKWKPAGEIIEVLNKPADVKFKGLEVINQQRYKTISDGFVSFQFNQPFLFVAEEI